MIKVSKSIQVHSCISNRLQEKTGTVGSLFLSGSHQGLSRISWLAPELCEGEKRFVLEVLPPELKDAGSQLTEYLNGARRSFELKLDLQGTPFQKKVWRVVADIPYGETLSYSDVAKILLQPRAVRAVATAIARNPLCVVIPCHRVIAAHGKMGGYSGGLAAKQFLLNLEQSSNCNNESL